MSIVIEASTRAATILLRWVSGSISGGAVMFHITIGRLKGRSELPFFQAKSSRNKNKSSFLFFLCFAFCPVARCAGVKQPQSLLSTNLVTSFCAALIECLFHLGGTIFDNDEETSSVFSDENMPLMFIFALFAFAFVRKGKNHLHFKLVVFTGIFPWTVQQEPISVLQTLRDHSLIGACMDHMQTIARKGLTYQHALKINFGKCPILKRGGNKM